MLVVRKQTLHKHFCGSQNATMKTGCVVLFWELVLLGLHYQKYRWEKLNLEDAGANMPQEYRKWFQINKDLQAYLNLPCRLDTQHNSEQL